MSTLVHSVEGDGTLSDAAGEGWQQVPPLDGTSIRVKQVDHYTHAFYQDGYWWYHSNNDDYAVGPDPTHWLPLVAAEHQEPAAPK